MDVSIIIPTHQRLNLLKIALKSCIEQSLVPSEIIIGDDSKDDLTENWIKAQNFPVNIRYQHNKPGLGQAGNVEDLIQMVQTGFFILLHDDDLLLSTALEDLIRAYKMSRNADVIFGKQYLINKEGEVLKNESEALNKHFSRSSNHEGLITKPLSVLFRQQLPSNSFLVKTDIAKKIHYGEPEKCGNGVDFHFCLKLSLNGCRYFYTDKFISYYRDSPDGVSKTSDSGYYAFKFIRAINVKDSTLCKLKEDSLKRLSPIAIIQAIRKDKKSEAWSIYISRWHRDKIFSPGGLNRLAQIILK